MTARDVTMTTHEDLAISAEKKFQFKADPLKGLELTNSKGKLKTLKLEVLKLHHYFETRSNISARHLGYI